jgi:uncharacterized protein YegL
MTNMSITPRPSTLFGLLALALVAGVAAQQPDNRIVVERAAVQTVVSASRLVTTTVDLRFVRTGDGDTLWRRVSVGFPETSFVSNVTALIDGVDFEGAVLAKADAEAEHAAATSSGQDSALVEENGPGIFFLNVSLSRDSPVALVRVTVTGLPTRDDGVFRDHVAVPADSEHVTIDIAFDDPLAPLVAGSAASKPAATAITATRISWSGPGDGLAKLDEIGGIGGSASASSTSVPRPTTSTSAQGTMAAFAFAYALGGPATRLMIAPSGEFLYVYTPDESVATAAATVVPKLSVLILDRSGSMSGSRIADAIRSAVAIIDELQPNDWFLIVSFASDVSKMSSAPKLATEANKASARSFVRGLRSGGGTDALPAVREAIDASRSFLRGESGLGVVPVAIFVSDGYPSDAHNFVDSATKSNTDEMMINSISIGNGADQDIMADLANRNAGVHIHVGDNDIISGIGALFNRFGRPIMAKPTISVSVKRGDIDLTGIEVIPGNTFRFDNVVNLFAGREIAIVGTFGKIDTEGNGWLKSGDVVTVTLTGVTGADAQQFTESTQGTEVPAPAGTISSVSAIVRVHQMAKIRTMLKGDLSVDNARDRATAEAVRAGFITELTSLIMRPVEKAVPVPSPGGAPVNGTASDNNSTAPIGNGTLASPSPTSAVPASGAPVPSNQAVPMGSPSPSPPISGSGGGGSSSTSGTADTSSGGMYSAAPGQLGIARGCLLASLAVLVAILF